VQKCVGLNPKVTEHFIEFIPDDEIIETKANTEAKQPEAKAEAEASRIWPRDRGQASRPNTPGYHRMWKASSFHFNIYHTVHK